MEPPWGVKHERSEESGRAAAVKYRDKSGLETIGWRNRLRIRSTPSELRVCVEGGRVAKFLEPHALVAQFGMHQPFLRRRLLPQMGYGVTVRRLLREQQQRDQQTYEGAMQFHEYKVQRTAV
jgi:hypothetical protein